MTVNLFMLILGVLLLCKIVDGYKKGMVKEIISFVSLIFLCIVIALIGNGLNSYLEGEFLNVVVMVLLLAVLGIVHHLMNLALLPAKLISKLPIVHGIDKLLGVVVGILETVLILWTIYTFVMMLDMGMTGNFIRECTAESSILTWFYEHNQLAGWIERFGAELSGQLHAIP